MRSTIRLRSIGPRSIVATAAVLGLLAAFPVAAGATVPTTDADTITATGGCLWTVKGNIVVDHPTVHDIGNLTAVLPDNGPVKGVKVKVSGRTGAGWFTEWGTAITNVDGFFSVTKSECADRAVKVEVQFEADDLKVTSSASKSWYEIFNTNTTIATSTINLNREPMGAGSGDQALAQARTDAQTWMVYRTALDYVVTQGSSFTNKVTVHNPATLTQGTSAADPILQDIHLDPTQTDRLDVMLHELGHVWLYQHGTGEGCLTWTALITGTTHDPVESECVAFQEGTAQYFARKLEQELNSAGLLASGVTTSAVLPYDRAKLSQTFGLTTLPLVGQQDNGWEQVNRVLYSFDVTRWLFGTSTDLPGTVGTYLGAACFGQPLNQNHLSTLFAVIGIDMDYSSVTVSSYLQRAADKLLGTDDVDKANLQMIVNPTKIDEPHTLYGC